MLKNLKGILLFTALLITTVSCSNEASDENKAAPHGAPLESDFKKKTKFPYKISKEKRARLLKDLKKIKLCMTQDEVKAILGEADYGWHTYGIKGRQPDWDGISTWYYIFARKLRVRAGSDPKFTVGFFPKDKVYAVHVTSVKGAKAINSPRDYCEKQ